MVEIAAAYPEEDWIQATIEDLGDDVDHELWFDLYLNAFDALRHDRQYGAFGGESPISYATLSQYARDHGIAGDDQVIFITLMSAIDAEYLSIAAERRKQRSQDS